MKSLYEAMLDPDLFGHTFGGPTFAAWRTVAKALDGLPLEPDELDLYRQITHRQAAPNRPFSEGYLVKPRRAGGTLFAAAVGLHAALQDYRDRLGPGEVATVAMIASDRRQARQLMNYVKGLIADSALISAEVTNPLFAGSLSSSWLICRCSKRNCDCLSADRARAARAILSTTLHADTTT
jgi:hypothetical protein